MFTYKASRYHAPVEAQFATIQECVDRAKSDMDLEQAWPVEVVDGGGNVVLTMDDLHKAIGTDLDLSQGDQVNSEGS